VAFAFVIALMAPAAAVTPSLQLSGAIQDEPCGYVGTATHMHDGAGSAYGPGDDSLWQVRRHELDDRRGREPGWLTALCPK
jgi:hypothetical protein